MFGLVVVIFCGDIGKLYIVRFFWVNIVICLFGKVSFVWWWGCYLRLIRKLDSYIVVI